MTNEEEQRLDDIQDVISDAKNYIAVLEKSGIATEGL